MSRRPTVFLTRGIPASGKSTWARSAVQLVPPRRVKLVSLDDLRRTMDCGRTHEGGFSKVDEEMVKRIQDEIVCAAVDAGRDVIVHNTHCFAKIPNRLRRLVCYKADLAIVDFSYADPELCKTRDFARPFEERVGPAVIDRMVDDLRKGKGGFRDWTVLTPGEALDLLKEPSTPVELEQVKHIEGAPSACIVDLDGTLAKHNGRDPYDGASCGTDLLDEQIARAAAAFPNVLLCSGRESTHRQATLDWLRRTVSECPFDGQTRERLMRAPLYMRAEGDFRPDSVVKLELFDNHIRGHFNIAAVFDDRDSVVRAWRSIGLPVWQVAEGRF